MNGIARSNKIDHTGQIFGKLTVVAPGPNTPEGSATWRCQCECGTLKIIRGQSLRRGATKACGCGSLGKRVVPEFGPPPGSRYILLPRGLSTLVDESDFERLSVHRWWFTVSDPARPYVIRTINSGSTLTVVTMPGAIMGIVGNEMVDHADRDTLNNRRENLRICSPHENMWNRIARGTGSIFKGIAFKRDTYRSKPWRASVMAGDPPKAIHLGYFKTAEEAACAYDSAARHYFGPFARVNFPEESSGERGAIRLDRLVSP